MNQRTVQLEISCLASQHCVDTVQRALLSHDGVFSAAINMREGRATVSYDAEVTNVQELIKAVQGEGYDAKAAEPAAAR